MTSEYVCILAGSGAGDLILCTANIGVALIPVGRGLAPAAYNTQTCNDKHKMFNDTPIKQKGTPTGNAVSISLTVLLSGTGKNNESEKRYF